MSEVLRAELSSLLRFELKDPRVALASISHVEVSRDLSHARVAVSVLGSDEDREAAVEALVGAGGFLRSQLGRRLRLRAAPELAFHLDRGAEHSQHISDLLDGLDIPPADGEDDDA